MSLSKYTELPDIDIAGQDLYETPEVPSPSLSDDDHDADDNQLPVPAPTAGAGRKSAAIVPSASTASNASGVGGGAIAKGSLDVEGAVAKFQRATEADARRADFSGALHHAPKKPAGRYPPTHTFETQTYEIRGYASHPSPQEKEKETPLAKLRRLRAETAALEEELALQAERPSQDSAEGEGAVSPLKILEQLRILRTDLGRLDAEESGGVAGGGGGSGWVGDARALIEKLAGGVGRAAEEEKEEGEGEGSSSRGTGTGTGIGGSAKELGLLESRLTTIESLVGIRPALVDDSKAPSRPLLPTMQRLEHQLTLFTQPRHLDAISRRVKVLVAELERAHEARAKLSSLPPVKPTSTGAGDEGKDGGGGGGGGGKEGTGSGSGTTPFGTADQLARLRSLFLLQTRLEPLLPLTPHLLTRLQSLSALHASSAHFASSLEALVDADRRVEERLREVRGLCEGLRSGMGEDEGRVRGNLEMVQGRMEELGRRMDALGL
ncbi:unnamed protein product [Tilletia controversa]|nr:unnamed protein product [Tilletia controversa]CAD6968164.1 unnamed protein product [Tilletia controversa]